ncbi:hypothetical protein CYMTET_42069 [Cymbomonas tetramitiformis]|uniref:Uncharacterized protein n=1 Tax=Cymbomonas tetramitiformis TaxID=36881 RepID=A0AAE0C4W6_9CHLO|nr:hypothetical protein CYMTET_42069 [Cymbomonas tetramitiformis]
MPRTCSKLLLRCRHRLHLGVWFGDPPSAEPCTAATDLVEIVLDLKRRQVKAPADTVNKRGFTPRADKPNLQNPRAMKTRFAAQPFPKEGNWSQSNSEKMAFHKGSGQTIPFCGNHECMRDRARVTGTATIRTRGYLASKFQRAIENDDAEKFDALCVLTGGKPEMIFDISDCSFCMDDGECVTTARRNRVHQEVQPTIADFLACRYDPLGKPQHRARTAPSSLHAVYMQDASADTGQCGRRQRHVRGHIPDDDSVQKSVVHGCRAMPPKGPPSFVRHVALPLLAVMCASAFAATAEPVTGDTVGGVPSWPPEASFVSDVGRITISRTPWDFDSGELTSTAPSFSSTHESHGT